MENINVSKANEVRVVRVGDKYYDMKSPNKAFNKVALDLRELDNPNWMKILEVKDPKVVEIDPHAVDENGKSTLTTEQMRRVMTECKKNPMYYIREVLKFDGGRSLPPYLQFLNLDNQ